MKKITLYYYSIRYLKFVQIFNRIIRRYKRIDCCPPQTVELRDKQKEWVRVELIESTFKGSDKFHFLNHSGEVGNWNEPSQSKLWLYNLHYFDDLKAHNTTERKVTHNNLIQRWIKDNPACTGNGWEPYPLSLRIINWIKYFISLNRASNDFNLSLYLQAKVLYQSIEYHLLGNHIFANAKALVFAGSYFKGDEAQRWFNKGIEILDREIKEQILPDGGNFELSPMYHNILLEDVLDLVNLSHVYGNQVLVDRLPQWEGVIFDMLHYSDKMSHKDREVSFFNDSAMKIAPKFNSLVSYYNSLFDKEFDSCGRACSKDEVVLNKFASSGYIVAELNEMKLILDVGNIGPDYIPGHAHADTLSFELSIGNQRVFVNSGTSVYGLGEERLRQRKTKTHNTVVVDGEDSSEVWSGFRVARRAYPSIPKINTNEQTIRVECSHDGYMRLPGKVTHTRIWQLDPKNLVVSDSLTGTFNDAEAHYHLHPDIQVFSEEDIIIQLPDNSKYCVKIEGGDAIVLDSTWHPEFGLSVANKKLLVNFKQKEVTFIFERVI